jgi:hypothetical protein
MIKIPRIILVLTFLLIFNVLRAQETIIRVPFSQPEMLVVDAGEDQDLYSGQSVTLGMDAKITGGTAGYQYAWKDTPGNEYAASTIAVTGPGSYYLTVTDEKHCSATDSVRVSQVTATGKSNAGSRFSIFPNPSGGVFFFRMENPAYPVKLEVVSVVGRVVFMQNFETSNPDITVKIDLSGFDRGVYYLKLTGNGASSVRSVIIR